MPSVVIRIRETFVSSLNKSFAVSVMPKKGSFRYSQAVQNITQDVRMVTEYNISTDQLFSYLTHNKLTQKGNTYILTISHSYK
jgi:hypothetical protein